MKYRYILSGGVMPSDRISDYRLVAPNQIRSTMQAIRIPADSLRLDKLCCDSYATTEDQRTIAEIGYDCMVRINGRLTVRNDLKPKSDCEMFMPHETLLRLGYTTTVCQRTVRGWNHEPCTEYLYTYLSPVHRKERQS